MKVKLDRQPSTNNNPEAFFAIRLFPETNEEMGLMEWGLEVKGLEADIMKVCNGSGEATFHYAMILKGRGKK